MSRAEILKKTQARLERAGIGYEQITVFGAIRINVHVKCLGRDTADKWVALLAGAFKGSRVSCTPTTWPAKTLPGTCLRPAMRDGWLIAVSA